MKIKKYSLITLLLIVILIFSACSESKNDKDIKVTIGANSAVADRDEDTKENQIEISVPYETDAFITKALSSGLKFKHLSKDDTLSNGKIIYKCPASKKNELLNSVKKYTKNRIDEISEKNGVIETVELNNEYDHITVLVNEEMYNGTKFKNFAKECSVPLAIYSALSGNMDSFDSFKVEVSVLSSENLTTLEEIEILSEDINSNNITSSKNS